MKRLLVIGLCLLCYATFLFAVDYMQKARCFHARAEEHRRSIALQRTTYFFCKQDERYYKRKAKKFIRQADYYTRRGKWKRVAQMNDRAEDAFAKAHPEYTFLVTPIGCGIAGFTAGEIAPLFYHAMDVENILLPEEFAAIVNDIHDRFINSFDQDADRSSDNW